MISNEGIAKNLYDLYDSLAGHELVHSGITGGFEFVRHEGFAWPNMAYRPGRSGPARREEIRLLKELMVSEGWPKLVLFDEEGMTGEVQELLAKERLIGATEWVNMALPVGKSAGHGRWESENVGKMGNLECRRIDVDNPGEWSQWASVVSGVLFKNTPLDPGLFRHPGIKQQFSLMTAYVDGKAVATCLLYFGESAGLYMVATLPEFQGKGFGRQLMGYSRAEAAARGYEFVVLHSTKAGLNFYSGLGFKSFGKLFLYYSMQ
jgi:ribosomal protein S18 acetylase RimI-like enzyme